MVHGAVPGQRCWFLLLSGLVIHLALMPMAAADLNQELQRIQPLKTSGRYFAALDALEQLEQAYQSSSRLKLEQALIYIQLEDFNSALVLLSQVLEDPSLPDTVRVQVQLLYLSTRRKQDSLPAAQWRARGQIGYFTGRDLGLASAQLSYAQQERVAIYNVRGYPWYLNRLWSARTNWYQDSTGDAAVWDMDIAAGLRKQLRKVTLTNQAGILVMPSDSGPYAQVGIGYQPGPGVQLAYWLKGQWLGSDFDHWQHRLSGVWLTETGWQSSLIFGVKAAVHEEDDHRFWQTAFTRPGILPLTLSLTQSDSANTNSTEVNLAIDWKIDSHWSLVPEVGYWDTNTWRGMRLAMGVEWTP